MGAERFGRLKELFADVCDLPAGERRAQLERLTVDAALIEEALALASENDVHTSRATRGAAPALAALAGGAQGMDTPEVKPGDSLGHWKLGEEIGHGGMGTVFRAERADGHFRQGSAVKVLQGLATPAALEYLGKERQILATLSHPNIARLLDGGTTPRGRPYLVMEYVEGIPIDRYCKARDLDLEQCLALFLGLCDAISFAHQRLVIHCDIKPSNVLVDRRGRAVLLDFGIARLVSRVEEPAAGARAFTPGFASPEQQAGESVGTPADIFGLGRLLETVLETAPARSRAWELRRIAAKATAAKPEERYLSAFMLADDIRRYLANQPLRAIEPTLAYRARKYAERRPVELIVLTVFILMLFAFAHRLGDERDAAVAARKAAEVQRDRARQAEAEAIRQRDLARRVERRAAP